MAASLFVEAESGTHVARLRHPHNGYYAGDFSQSPVRSGLSAAIPAQADDRRPPAPPAPWEL